MSQKHTKMILIRAERILNYRNGLVGIEVECHPLPDADHATLYRLFPNLADRAYRLLDQESLFATIHEGPLPESPGVEVVECNDAQPPNDRLTKFKNEASSY